MGPSHRRDAHRTQNSSAVVNAAIQNHLAKNRQIIHGRKQPGMTRDATHAKRSRIVYLAAEPLLAFRPGIRARIAQIVHLTTSLFCRRNARSKFRVRTETRVSHAKWNENILARKFIEHLSTDAMNHFAQRDVIDVTIDEACARWSPQRLVIEAFHRFVVAVPALFQIKVRSKACRVHK